MFKILPAVLLMFPTFAWAVSGQFDVGTYSYKSYEANWQKAKSGWVEWVNTDDWVEEMGDIASLHTEKNPRQLEDRVTNDPYAIFDYDIMFFATHGYGAGSGSNAVATMTAWEKNSRINLREVTPVHDEMEILLLQVCNVLAKSDVTDWYVLRNLHSQGALVTAGCYSGCWRVNTGYNTTFNQLGDEIVDNHKIKNAWIHAHDLLLEIKNDDLKVDGLGAKSDDNCDNRARNVNRKNRLNYHKYQYGKDEPITGDHEICGYYYNDV